MPRAGRIILPHYPHHIVQRGHNRQVVFKNDQDFRRYLTNLYELKIRFGVRVYAYCIMSNHIHLLLAPSDPAGLACLMKALAGRTTRYRNKLEHCSGTLWESRYKSSLVQWDAYLLCCCRYIELNPVRAGMVKTPGEYLWSSYRSRMGEALESEIACFDPDPCYLALAVDEDVRHLRYRAFIEGAIPEPEVRLIRSALQRGQLTGCREFVQEVEQRLGRRIESRGRGRPHKTNKSVPLNGADR